MSSHFVAYSPDDGTFVRNLAALLERRQMPRRPFRGVFQTDGAPTPRPVCDGYAVPHHCRACRLLTGSQQLNVTIHPGRGLEIGVYLSFRVNISVEWRARN